jgi:hypothetical protein
MTLGLRNGSSSTAPALQVCSSEFKLQLPPPKKKKKKKRKENLTLGNVKNTFK